MADGIHAKTDLSSVQAGLAKLAGPLRESLARSMAVAGGKVLRDEAKLLAPVGTEEGGSIHPGALRNAIYLAFKDSGSTGKNIRYSVSWNAKKAPHGAPSPAAGGEPLVEQFKAIAAPERLAVDDEKRRTEDAPGQRSRYRVA